jgi:hypothetical protein
MWKYPIESDCIYYCTPSGLTAEMEIAEMETKSMPKIFSFGVPISKTFTFVEQKKPTAITTEVDFRFATPYLTVVFQ